MHDYKDYAERRAGKTLCVGWLYNEGVGCICKLLLTLSFGTDLAYKQMFPVYTLTVGVTVID